MSKESSLSQPQRRESASREDRRQGSGTCSAPASAEPSDLVSIIVVSYNNLSYTRLCIDSIFARTDYPCVEVVVVDNASTDGTGEYLRSTAGHLSHMKVVLQEENTGFAAALNTGIRASTGEYLVFLNNDTIITTGLISGLVRYLQDKEIGLVGPMTNNVANEARVKVPYSSIDEIEEYAAQHATAHRGESFCIKTLAFFCAALRREVVEEVGYLDERFAIGMFEDDDYSLSLWQKGYKVVCAADLYVHHFGQASFSKLPQEEYLRILNENRQKFEKKWSVTWEPHIHSARFDADGEIHGLRRAVAAVSQAARERRPWALTSALSVAEVLQQRLQQRLEAEHDEAAATCERLLDQRSRMEARHRQLRGELEVEQAARRRMLDELQAERTRRHRLQDELDQTQAGGSRLQDELQELQVRRQRLQDELQNSVATGDQLRNQLHESQVRQRRLQDELQEARATGSRLLNELQESAARQGRLSHELVQARADGERLRRELASERATVDQLLAAGPTASQEQDNATATGSGQDRHALAAQAGSEPETLSTRETRQAAQPAVRTADPQVEAAVRAWLQEADPDARVVIFLPSVGWSHQLFQRPHQLALSFARSGTRVIFCTEDPADEARGCQEIEPNLLLCSWPVPVPDLRPVVVWTFSYNYHLSEPLAERAVIVYDWIDDLSVFPQDASLVESNHLTALQRADVVACVAGRLHTEALTVRPDAVYLPNGVDYDHFSQESAILPADPQVEAVLARGNPIAGYCGALAEWFDFQLLADVARHRPDWSFLLIGPQYAGFGSLRSQPALQLANVHWIGPRQYRTLAAYLQLFDVAMIPFRINEITLATSPIKMYEYFAAGKPVIATPLPECRDLPEVHIVQTFEELSTALDRGRLEARDPERRRHLQELARQHTWQRRVAAVLPQLEGKTEVQARPQQAPMLLMESLLQARTRSRELAEELGRSRRQAAADLAGRRELEVRLTIVREQSRERRVNEEQLRREADTCAAELEGQLAASQQQLAQLEAQLVGERDRRQEVQAAEQQLGIEQAEARGNLRRLEQELADTGVRLEVSRQQLCESRLREQQQRATAAAHSVQLEARLSELQQQVARLEARHETDRRQLSESRGLEQQLRTEQARAGARLKETERQRDEQESRLEQLMAELQRHQAELGKLQEHRQHLELDLQQHRAELGKLQEYRQHLELDLQQHRAELGKLQEHRQHLEQQLQEQSLSNEQLATALAQAEQTVATQAHHVEAQHHEIARLGGELQQREHRLAEVTGAYQALLDRRPIARLRRVTGKVYRTGALTIARLLRWWHRTPPDEPNFRNWYQFRFDRYKMTRIATIGAGVDALRCPSQPGLVSIVLPVYNGERYVAEAIESVLSQSYANFELIVVNDGSTDSTPQIADHLAAGDPRIRVVHQENQKLPASLSNGFRLARGELLTWTSDDNRLRPDCLERLVDCLRRHPDWDMVYANLDIIGDDGELLVDSDWYRGYQVPPGSPHVHLPHDTAELNIWPNNYVGAAFLYRDRVAQLLGDYSGQRFTTEDYDYWQQVNELLTLRHADFDSPVYEYRFHPRSLTAREGELDILGIRERLMVFDDFRRDFNLTPLVWIFDNEGVEGKSARSLQRLEKRVRAAGHLVITADRYDPQALPRLWFPVVYLRLADTAAATVDRERLPRTTLTVLAVPADEGLSPPSDMPECWDLCVCLGKKGLQPHPTGQPYQGWYAVSDLCAALTALDVRARTHHLRAIDAEIEAPSPPQYRFTVIVCTCGTSERLIRAIRSACQQSYEQHQPHSWEVLVVNNSPAEDLSPLIGELRQELFPGQGDRLRLIDCPLKGLSHARNAGISEARGEVLCFIDDDAVARPDWLAEIATAWNDGPDAGVVGGKILLKKPDPTPAWIDKVDLGFWSHFDRDYDGVTWLDDWPSFPWGANWTARRRALVESGGFRCHYGRKGDDFGGGEELVAAVLIQRLGYRIGVVPSAVVEHHVEERRFTRQHVRKTIRASTHVNYRLQTDLYVPRWLGPAEVLKSVYHHARCLLDGKRREGRPLLVVGSTLLAELRLLRTIARDYLARATRRW